MDLFAGVEEFYEDACSRGERAPVGKPWPNFLASSPFLVTSFPLRTLFPFDRLCAPGRSLSMAVFTE